MIDRLTVLVSDPDARVIEAETGTWVVSGVRTGALESLIRRAESVAAVRRRVGSATEDAALVHVSDDRRTVRAYRTVVGSRRLYFLRGSDGGAVVTDHFRTALARLDAGDRTVPRSALADHLLFRAPIPPSTFVSEIGCVPQGEWLTWDLDADERALTAVDRLSPGPPLRPKAAIDRLDGLLADALRFDDDRPASNLYSGGVDSTLVQSYLGDSVPMLNVGIDSPEYAFEVEYAREGGARFDAEFRQEILDEREVLERLESSVDALGSPAFPLMTPLIDAAFARGNDRRYMMAINADTLCGDAGTKGARVASWLAPVLLSPLGALAGRTAPSGIGSRIRRLRSIARRQRYDPSDPRSFPQQFVAYTKPALVADVLGEDVVKARCRAQVRHVRDRLDFAPAGSRFERQIEAAHLLSMYAHRIGCRWRQLAASHGNALETPFETRSVAECVLSVPASRRYVEGPPRARRLRTKHLLKRLLARRLPSYPTTQPKGAGVLPFERYFEEGALTGVFDRYDVPEFVPDELREAAIEDSGRQAWNLVTYAVWRDRVLRDPALEPAPSPIRLEWRAAPRVS
ncbi:asparagine synthase-related protein [Halegenticoccus soli]|uniref:asparagine synthase-related protein n=1 Tax=Halegenticoccus soli TaxID=1985678 RepID=UPI000C6D1845|nr:asparagine synthase-related protein [Halegenticoccus soli]